MGNKAALFVWCGILLFSGADGQRLSNVRASAQGSLVTITYDLSGSPANEKFRVSLFASHDNFTNALRQVTGDVGDKEVTAGVGRRVEWNAGNELSSFSGSITFEIRAEVVSTPIAITQPQAGSRYKRGQTLDVHWQNARSSSGTLELQQNGSTVAKLGEGRDGSMSWTIPDDLKPGGGYRIKYVSGSESALSGEFKVAPKIPIGVKVLPVVVVGAVAYLLLSGDKEEPLPLPPDPQ